MTLGSCGEYLSFLFSTEMQQLMESTCTSCHCKRFVDGSCAAEHVKARSATKKKRQVSKYATTRAAVTATVAFAPVSAARDVTALCTYSVSWTFTLRALRMQHAGYGRTCDSRQICVGTGLWSQSCACHCRRIELRQCERERKVGSGAIQDYKNTL